MTKNPDACKPARNYHQLFLYKFLEERNSVPSPTAHRPICRGGEGFISISKKHSYVQRSGFSELRGCSTSNHLNRSIEKKRSMFVTPKVAASAALCFTLLLSLMLRPLVIAGKQQVTVDDLYERGKGKLISTLNACFQALSVAT